MVGSRKRGIVVGAGRDQKAMQKGKEFVAVEKDPAAGFGTAKRPLVGSIAQEIAVHCFVIEDLGIDRTGTMDPSAVRFADRKIVGGRAERDAAGAGCG